MAGSGVVESRSSAGPRPPAGATPPGWYPNPHGSDSLRWWNGDAWTAWTATARTVRVAPLVDRPVMGTPDREHLAFAREVLMPELRARGCLGDPLAVLRADSLLYELDAEASGAHPEPAPVLQPAPAAAWTEPAVPVATPDAALAPVAAQPARHVTRPRRLAPRWLTSWWEGAGSSVRSDLAVHGIAYLGVLLFFVGAFGLVAFAFGDVSRSMRPVAEVVIAVAPFAAAWLLLRRGAVIVGRALEVAGGLVLPVMVITSFLDGVGFPPELTGTALVVALTILSALIGVGYAAWSGRHPASALRYLVAPMAWITMAMACLGLGRAVPSGEAVATPGAAQVSATLAALLATVAWARLRPEHRLSEPTMVAAVPGLAILSTLAVLTWLSGPVAPAAVLTAGASAVAALELLAPRLGQAAVGLLEPAWWALASAFLVDAMGDAAGSAVAATGFVVLVELAGRRPRAAWAVCLPAVAWLLWLPAMASQPWVAAGWFAALAVWALARRLAPFRLPFAAVTLDAVAGVALAATAILVGVAASIAWGVLLGSLMVLLATAGARLRLLVRGPDDHFWTSLWAVGLGLVAVAALITGSLADQGQPTGRPGGWWLLAAAVLALVVAAVAGPVRPRARLWAGVMLGAWDWVLVCTAAALPWRTCGVVLAVAGVAMVVAVHAVRRGPGAGGGLLGDVGLAGHLLGLLAPSLAGPGWGATTALGLATAGWAVTAGQDARGRSPVGVLLARIGSPWSYVPPTLAALGLPLTLVLGVASAQALGGPWPSALLGATAVGYAVAARSGPPARIATVLAWVAFLMGVLAPAVASEPRGGQVGLAALITTVVVLPSARRARVMTWAAWAAVAPLVGLLAVELVPGVDQLDRAAQASLTLTGVGGVMVLAAGAVDLRFGPWVPRWRPRTRALEPPAVVGGAELLAGLAAALGALPPAAAGGLVLACAGVLVALALLSRAGVLGGAAAVVAWTGALLLADPPGDVSPWVAVLVSTVLLVAAEAASRLVHESRWWARWDLGLVLSAAPAALTALAVAQEPADAPTSAAVGALLIAVAARLRDHVRLAVPLGGAGTLLVLAGADRAGALWLAGALLLLGLALSAAAARVSGRAKPALEACGAVAILAGWAQLAGQWSLAPQVALDLDMLALAAVALGAGLVARTRVDRSWAWVWGTIGVVGVAAGTVLAETGKYLEPTVATAGSLGVVAVGLLVAAEPLRVPGLLDLAGLSGLAAAVVLLQVVDSDGSSWSIALGALSAALAVLLLAAGTRLSGAARRTVIECGVLTAGLASVTAPNPAALCVALLVAALQAAAIGTVLRLLAVQVLSPVLACAAWLVFASGVPSALAEWYVAPIALAALVVVALWRHDCRMRGSRADSAPIVVLELVAIGLLVAPSLVRSVSEGALHAAVGMGLGVVLTMWGLLTRVRRRLVAGVAVVLVSVVLLLAVPLVQLAPAWGSAVLWILIAVVGMLAVLGATLLEEGRRAAHTAAGRFREATQDWE